MEAFDKPASFDPRVDSIVRVEACRLRSRIKGYYETLGRLDPVVIEYRKGGYAPFFRPGHDPAPPDPDSVPQEPASHKSGIIAVLPFAGLSAANNQGYFADGITEEIIHALTRIEGLQIVAQTSVFEYKNRAPDVRQIGRNLGSDMVLEGSLRKGGPVLRITAQLADVATGCILRSGTYERLLENIFAVQKEISQTIVDALKARVLPDSNAHPEA